MSSKLLLLHTSHLTAVHLRSAITSTFLSFSTNSPSSSSTYIPPRSSRPLVHSSPRHRTFSVKVFDAENDGAVSASEEKPKAETESGGDGISSGKKASDEDTYPSGEFEFREFGAWKIFAVKCKMLVAFPWQRVRKGSVLTMKLRGQITDQLKSRFSSGLSLPQISENFLKAAYDPRISGIYLHIDPLNCGWGKVEEIRRHILDFKKSGKFIVGFAPACGEKEYYIGCACEELYAPPSAYFSLYGLTVQAQFLGGVLEKVGIEPQVERIGKYKSAGDQLVRKNISEANREMLTALLDNIYNNWVDKVSHTLGKKKEDIENFINEGVYRVEQLKEEGWITDIKYDDEVMSMLKERLKLTKDKSLPTVDYRKYSGVRRWTLGLTGYADQIAVIRASGSISRSRSSFSVGGSGIVAENIIEKIRSVRESKKYKAAIIRIDSPGGDALASDLMWREIRLLAESKPVIASMGDVAASGGYYMAMGTGTIVAENLTLTGSIGVVTDGYNAGIIYVGMDLWEEQEHVGLLYAGKFSLGKLYEKIGFNKEIISRGKFSELTAADQRPFRPDEAELFAKSAQNAYKQFRDKAAVSRSMPVEKMEEVAQGRVWTGNDAASRGLVDAIGGFHRSVAIAKRKANIPQDHEVTLVEMVKPSASLPGILSGIGSSLAGADRILNLVEELGSSNGIQARMDGIIFQNMDGVDSSSPILRLMKDILASL